MKHDNQARGLEEKDPSVISVTDIDPLSDLESAWYAYWRQIILRRLQFHATERTDKGVGRWIACEMSSIDCGVCCSWICLSLSGVIKRKYFRRMQGRRTEKHTLKSNTSVGIRPRLN